jgi:hypothetical protein
MYASITSLGSSFIKANFATTKAWLLVGRGCRGLATMGLLLSSLSAIAQTQTPFGCNSSTYLFQGNATSGYILDFATGSATKQGTNNGNNGNIYNNSTLNAIGYNPKDGYIWSQLNGQAQLVRVGSEFVGKAYPFTQPANKSQTTFTVGDVDVNGVMYMTRGGSSEGINNPNTDVYTIDLKQTTMSPAPASLVANVLTFPNRTFLTDWAVSPKDSCLYAINTYFVGQNFANNENNTKIYRFVTHNRRINGVVTLAGTRETLGVAAGGSGSNALVPANFAAAFMDSNGSFYVVANGTGLVYRIDRPDLLAAVPDANATATTIPATYVVTAQLGDVNTNSNVDGARCAFSRPTAGALPVTLTSFVATAAPNRTVQLRWTTASEVNNDFFEVQHSLDGRTFAAIGRVQGHGNAVQASTYLFTDPAPSDAATHYYRLRQVDLDGASTFGPMQAITLTPGSSAIQLSVAPNPTTSDNLRIQVQYAGAAPTAATLTVRNALGQALVNQPVVLQPGATALAPSTRLLPGVYWLAVSGDAQVGTQGVRVVISN